MSTIRKYDPNGGIQKIKGYSFEQFYAEVGDWMPGLVKTVREGCEALDKDGNPDWNSRFKFIQLVMHYAMGKPKEVVQVETSGTQGIFIGNLKGESDEQDSREDVQA